MMKPQTSFFLYSLLLILLLLVNACSLFKDDIKRGHWLCSVDSSGTNFTRILQNKYETTGSFLDLEYHDYLIGVESGYNKLFLTYNEAYSYEICNDDGSGQHLISFPIGNLSADGKHAYSIRNNSLYRFDFSDESYTRLYENIGNVQNPLPDRNEENLCMVENIYNSDSDNWESCIYLYNIASNSLNQIPVSQKLNTAYYLSDLNSFLCLSNSSVFRIKPDSTEYEELYNFGSELYSRYFPGAPVNYGHKFIVVDNLSNIILIDSEDATQVVIGQASMVSDVYEGYVVPRYQIDICRNNKYVFYLCNKNIMRYNLETNTSENIFSHLSGADSNNQIYHLCSAPDGSKVYFIANIYQ